GENGGVVVLVVEREAVRMPRRADGVDSNLDGATGAVLEADRTGQAGYHLPVALAFGGARADGAPGYQVDQELRCEQVEEFDTCRHTFVRQLQQQTARQ